MKFCPQCGTAFEPEARFCLECGFDRSTIGDTLPETLSVPGTVVEETPTTHTETVSETPSATKEIKPACPQCRTLLIPGDRFCLECGFDTSAVVAESIIAEGKAAEVNAPPVIIQLENPITTEIKQFCPQCGTGIDKNERFCQECGFDTSGEMPGNTTPKAITEPLAVKPEPVIAATNEVKASMNKNSYQQTQSINPTVNINNTGTQQKAKKTWVIIFLVVIGICVLGAGGWFAYDSFFSSADEVIADTTSVVTIPETNYSDTIVPDAESTETSSEATTAKPQTPAKPQSKIDQELAKYKEKEKNKSTQQTSSTTATKPDLGVKVSSNATVNNILSKVIHEVGRKEDPKGKKPKNPTKLTLQKPTMIVRITTDHYNEGMGTSDGGSITIKDRDGNSIGTYKATGKSGYGGAPNAKWVIEPNKLLEKGTYYIWDSDFSTWSKNLLGNGFVVVEGYEVE